MLFRGLLAIVVVVVVACTGPAPLTETTRETVTIQSVDLPGALWDPFMPAIEEGTAVEIEATLTLPPTEEAVPVVLITHGCGGPGDSERSWAGFLERRGIGSLLLDHFGGRRVGTICFGGETLNVASILVDLYRAAESLEDNPYVDADRIAVLGLSFGGRAALWSAMTRFRQMYDGRSFSGHMAFYPSTCFITLEDEHEVSGAPVRIFHGTADDWTPIGQCRDYVERMREHDVDIELLAYDGAPHGFDMSSGPIPAVEIPAVSPRGCAFEERSGEIIDTDTGEVAGVRSKCVEIGVHYGYDPAAAEKAREDVAAFLGEIFGH